jgi:O-antigen/teichoic acid export membrane protein
MLPYRRIAKNVNAVVFPAFSRHQENSESLRLKFQKTILSISLLSYPIMVGLILVAPEFIQILLGPKWTPVITPFRILCIAGIFNFLVGIIVSAIKAQGLAKALVFRESISGAILIVGVIIGSFKGLIGISIAVVLYNLLQVFLLASLLIFRTQLVKWSDFLNPQIVPLISALSMAIGVSALRGLLRIQFTFSHPIIILVSCALLGALIYITILLIFKSNEVVALKREVLNDVNSIFKKVNFR